ncbi:SEC14-like protein 2 like protein [Argiope bruennichi]|uniref:SEC14-like protein 2 like protein n=1 Tax=Argiope bruennichi TaxID=94029 RepID=A0A8T0FXD8_ARGBR|nr:SEC14-like protein 2 like protein [Argiope bruennichi]
MTFENDLTNEQKAAIEELKRRTINDITPKMREDETLYYRFLKARDFDLEDSETMLRKHIAWRKEFQVDTILTDFKPPEVLVKCLPFTFIGHDREGSPVIYADMNCDVNGILRSARKIDLFKYVILVIEKLIEDMKEQSVKQGKAVTTMVQIFDYGKMTFAKATNKKSIELAKFVVSLFQDNYPEKLKVVFDINASFYFTLFFPLVKVIIAPAVYNKIRFYGTENWKEDLLEIIDADELPAFLGGNRTDPDGDPMCNSFVNHAETVPESYYLKKSEKILCNTPGVEKITVSRFSKETLTFEVKEANSFLEWEFETKNKDIGFSVHFKVNDSKIVEVLPKQRMDTYYGSETGVYRCEKPGTSPGHLVRSSALSHSFKLTPQMEKTLGVHPNFPSKPELGMACPQVNPQFSTSYHLLKDDFTHFTPKTSETTRLFPKCT